MSQSEISLDFAIQQYAFELVKAIFLFSLCQHDENNLDRLYRLLRQYKNALSNNTKEEVEKSKCELNNLLCAIHTTRFSLLLILFTK